MQIILQAGDIIPTGGKLEIDLGEARMHRMSDGRVIFDLQGCNALAQPRPMDISDPVGGWFVDDEGIITRRA